MKTISVTKTYAVLDEEDIEKAASSYLGRDVKIEELDLTIADQVPMDTGEPNGMSFYLRCDGEFAGDDYELFYDKKKKGHYLPSGEFLGDNFMEEAFLDLKLIFGFDVSRFKSVDRYIDSSD